MNKFKYDLEDYLEEKDAKAILSRYLNSGVLSLCLGSGASYDMSLPMWNELVYKIYSKIGLSNLKIRDTLRKKVNDDKENKFKNLSNEDLKKITESIKKSIGNQSKYFELVKKELYDDVNFDFSLAKKETLIALSSLIIGKYRGTVKNIMTYNFDSVIEWYLGINGLKCNNITPYEILSDNSDVNIIHIHGFLPQVELEDKYDNSNFLVFSKKEFEDRNLDPQDLWKEIMELFFRQNIFLSVGLSAESIINDICPHLRNILKNKYESKSMNRHDPFGFSIIPEFDEEQKEDLIEHGIVPVKISISEIPSFLFSIVQYAAKIK